MSKFRAITVIAVLLGPLSFEASAGFRPARGSESLPGLFQSSSAVFTGDIVSVESTSEAKDARKADGEVQRVKIFTALAAVDRQYKGDQAKVVRIVYSRPNDSTCAVSYCESIEKGEYGLFFVAKGQDGYHLLDPFFGQFAVSRLKSSNYSSGLPSLESDLIAGLHDTDDKRLLANIELIGGMGHLDSVSPLTDLLARRNDSAVRGATFLALLRLHSYSRLKDSLAFAEEDAQDSRALDLKDQISSWIAEIRDPIAVNSLMDFSSSSSDQLREATVHALREIGSPQAVPVFIKRLDDPVELIRYDAVLGLATAEKKWELAPSVETFSADQAKYVSAWKTWWVTTGRISYR